MILALFLNLKNCHFKKNKRFNDHRKKFAKNFRRQKCHQKSYFNQNMIYKTLKNSSKKFLKKIK